MKGFDVKREKRFWLNTCLVFLICWSVMDAPAWAQEGVVQAFKGKLEAPQNKRRVLVISDESGVLKKFKIADIEQLTLYETTLPAIYEGEEGAYQGVLLDDLLKAAGVESYQRVRMSALDGYVVEYAQKPLRGTNGFIATRFRGQEMSIENKGYTRLLLPSQIDWKVPANTNTSSWIWNLNQITILK